MSDANFFGRYASSPDPAGEAYQELSSPGIPVPLAPVLRRCGIQPLLGNRILTGGPGGRLFEEDGHWYMVFRPHTALEEIRLCAAEELGHFLLGHPLKGGRVRQFDASSPGMHAISEQFAARFLLPGVSSHDSADELAHRHVVPRLFVLSHLSLLQSEEKNATFS